MSPPMSHMTPLMSHMIPHTSQHMSHTSQHLSHTSQHLSHTSLHMSHTSPHTSQHMSQNDISQDLRERIVELHNEGLGYRKTSAQLCVSIASVGTIIRNWKCRNTTLNKPRTGRPRKINDRAARKLVRTVVQRPQSTREDLKDDLKASGIEASKHTISRALHREGLRSRTPRRTPLLQKRHVKTRLKNANDHLNKPAAFWNSVQWSDEIKIELFRRTSTNHVWRQQNEEYKPKCTIPTVEFGGDSIIVWGCFSSSGVGKLHIIEGTMNGRKYREILEEQLLPSARLLKLKRGWKFQQDNDPKHTANETKKWLRMKKINILEWPSQSPDMNPIENLERIEIEDSEERSQ
ncbi:Transposase Tc1-like [Trinorchestia longiramus]|nr:Transposase Tc1-like [Trinorchestia longiramus]